MKNFFAKVKSTMKTLTLVGFGMMKAASYDELFRITLLVGGSIAVAIIIFKRLMKDSSLKKNKPTDEYSKSIDFPREVEEDMSIIHPFMRKTVESMLGKNIVAKNFNKNRTYTDSSYPHFNKYMAQAGKYDKKKGGMKAEPYCYENDFFREDARLYDEAMERAERKEREERKERAIKKAKKAEKHEAKKEERVAKPKIRLMDDVDTIFGKYGLSF